MSDMWFRICVVVFILCIFFSIANGYAGRVRIAMRCPNPECNEPVVCSGCGKLIILEEQ